MTSVRLECPSCNKKGILDINHEIIKNNGRGITGVTVAENIICSHTFIAYIDRNLVVRDCFLVDFTVKLPKIEVKETESNYKVDDYTDIDLYLISINIRAQTLASIFRGIFLNQRMVLINDIDIINSHLLMLLEYSFRSSFDYDFSIVNKTEYGQNKKKFKGYLIFSLEGIIKDDLGLLTPKKMKIENAIVQKFLSVNDIMSSLIVLKNEIYKVCEIAKNAVGYFNGLPEKEKKIFSIFKLSEYLNSNAISEFNIKLQKTYLDFLIDIILYYFKLNISIKAKPEDFLGYL